MMTKKTVILSSTVLGAGLVVMALLILLTMLHPQPAAGVASQTATITGRIHDAEGAALANADVWAEPFGDGPVMGVQSDVTGVYTITGLTAGDYRVGAGKFGYATEYYSNSFSYEHATPVSVSDGGTASDIDFFLDPGGMITGTVKDTSGVPITTAHVNASPASGAPWGAGTDQIDSTGTYTLTGLPPGKYKVEANAEGYEREYFHEKIDWMLADPVPVTATQVTPNINFTLPGEQGGTVFGQVVLPNGNPVPHAWVSAESFEHNRFKDGNADENGTFRIGGLITGTWRLRAQPPDDPAYKDYSESRVVAVPVTATSTITLTKPLTLTKVNVVGRAVMPDGTGVPWAGVDVFTPDFSRHKGSSTDHEGYFRFGGLPADNYKLQLHLPWGTSGLVAPPPLDFAITDPNTIVNLGNITFTRAVKHITGVVVRTNSGAGVSDVEVNASLRGADGWAWDRTDSAGTFNLDVAPGDWEVMIHPSPEGGTADWVYTGMPKMVRFARDNVEETRRVTFTVETADAYVTGRVEGPNGEELRPWSVWIDVRNLNGHGNGTSISPGGRFTVPIQSGTYFAWIGVDEQIYPYWSSPRLNSFNVGSGETKDLGVIRLVEKTATIEGRVTRSDTGTGVAGLRVNAWQQEGGWASTTTKSDGSYSMSVISGTWEIDAELPITSTYVTGHPPRRVNVEHNETITGVNFVLHPSAGEIQGTLRDSDGNLLTDVDGWAYARRKNAAEPIAGAPISNGRFTLNVPTGTYMVGLWLPPNSGYTPSAEQEVGPLDMTQLVAEAKTPAQVAALDVSAGERQARVKTGSTITLTFTLLRNDARIVGTFYTDDAKTTPAVGLHGEVFAMSGIGGAWQATPIDPTDASFELAVAPGTWNLGYWLESPGYVNSPPPDTRVTISSTQVFTFNFTVVQADARIEGRIEGPDGTPLNYAWAWAHRNRTSSSAAIDTGDESTPPNARFRIDVPSGGQYHVGAHAPEEWGYIQPDAKIVTPTTTSPVSVTLRFKESNGIITGSVSYHDDKGNPVYGPWAWVYAWSDDGQHTGAPTNADGEYRLNVVTDTTWHVGAAYQAEEGALFYETITPTTIVMSTTQASADLELELASTALPPAVANTFDPSIGWTHTLSDGTRIEIPAGAMPTTDTVRISVTPLVEELPNTLSARPFGLGYAIAAYENSSGNQIVKNFNANVLITFYYTEDQLRRRGVSEDDLSPAYFSTTTNSWTKVESFTVDKDANRVTVQINHFSTWALTMPATAEQEEAPPGTRLYLPLVLR